MASLTGAEQLRQYANDNGIAVCDLHLSDQKKAVSFDLGHEIKCIALDKPNIPTVAEERTLLAEEIGHHKTHSLYSLTAAYNSPLARQNRNKCEAKAKQWAIKKVLPASVIRKAMKDGARNDYELAEYCEVPLGYLKDALVYYEAIGIRFEAGGMNH